MSFKHRTCEYIRITDLVPLHWDHWFWEYISENAPFSWGDAEITLVTAEDLYSFVYDKIDLGDTDSLPLPTSEEEIVEFFEQLKKLGKTYIDLEN